MAKTKTLTVDQMIEAIESRCCIRKLWRCKAGWGMVFVQEHEEPPAPEGAEEREGLEGFRRYMQRYREWQDRCLELSCDHEVVHKYYSTLEACVRAEYEARVVREEEP